MRDRKLFLSGQRDGMINNNVHLNEFYYLFWPPKFENYFINLKQTREVICQLVLALEEGHVSLAMSGAQYFKFWRLIRNFYFSTSPMSHLSDYYFSFF